MKFQSQDQQAILGRLNYLFMVLLCSMFTGFTSVNMTFAMSEPFQQQVKYNKETRIIMIKKLEAEKKKPMIILLSS